MKKNRLGIFLLLIISCAALLGGLLGGEVSAGAPENENVEQLLKTFTEVLATIESHYVRKIPSDKLVESAVRGLLRTLDPHSSFFSRTDYNRLQEEQQGKYYGLGITIRAEAPGSGRVIVVEPPSPGTPAYKAGLKAGDVIAKIEGESIADWDINEQVIPNLKGPKGTKVTITVERPGEPQPLEFTIERDEIPLYTIKYTFPLRPDVGYIRIDKFSETTGDELQKALRKLGQDRLQGLILDLRDNPGGALSQAIEVSEQFLRKGQTIVSTRNREGKDREYEARRGRLYDYPMVVLINENSASASEIVAGALQDHDRAMIVGQTSFGKALVQTIYPLEGNRGLALTTGKYYTPSDRLIQRDYSESFYDYYFTRARAGSKEEKYETDNGRTVYAGGGITPDEVVELDTYSRLVRQIQRDNLFQKFATQLVDGKIESDIRYHYPREEISALSEEEKKALMDKVVVTERTLALFRDYLRSQGISFSDEEFEADQKIISNRLRQEIFLPVFGDVESYRIALELDRQVQRALELLPQAQALVSRR